MLEDLMERFGFPPLGAGQGSLKNAVLGGNAARLYENEAHPPMADGPRCCHGSMENHFPSPLKR